MQTGSVSKIWQDIKICTTCLDVSLPLRLWIECIIVRPCTGAIQALTFSLYILKAGPNSTTSFNSFSVFLWFFLSLELIVQDRLVQGNFVQDFLSRSSFPLHILVLEFQNNLWGLGTEQEQSCRTGPPGNIGWWNRFLRIDFWAPLKFKPPSQFSVTLQSIGNLEENTRSGH